jgi:hypothetical protein
MINYYFFQFKKNNNRTGPDRVRPVGVRPPGQRWDVFGFFEFEPSRTGLCGPWTVRIWTEPARTRPFSNH